jgi:hypothetical protein
LNAVPDLDAGGSPHSGRRYIPVVVRYGAWGETDSSVRWAVAHLVYTPVGEKIEAACQISLLWAIHIRKYAAKMDNSLLEAQREHTGRHWAPYW